MGLAISVSSTITEAYEGPNINSNIGIGGGKQIKITSKIGVKRAPINEKSMNISRCKMLSSLFSVISLGAQSFTFLKGRSPSRQKWRFYI